MLILLQTQINFCFGNIKYCAFVFCVHTLRFMKMACLFDNMNYLMDSFSTSDIQRSGEHCSNAVTPSRVELIFYFNVDLPCY